MAVRLGKLRSPTVDSRVVVALVGSFGLILMRLLDMGSC